MRLAFEAAEGSYNILCVSSVSRPIYRVFRTISGNTSFLYISDYSEVPIDTLLGEKTIPVQAKDQSELAPALAERSLVRARLSIGPMLFSGIPVA